MKKDLVDKMLEAFEREWTFDMTSNRTAMKAAVRVLTNVPFEELGINEDDEEEDLEITIVDSGWCKETTERLTRMEEKLDRIISHLEATTKDSSAHPQ